MRLVCFVDQLLKDMKLTEKQFEARFGVPYRTIQKLRNGERDWELSAANLTKLWRVAYDQGYERGIFDLQAHPIWDTFDAEKSEKPKAVVYRGIPTVDSDMEGKVRAFVERLGCETEPRLGNSNGGLKMQEIADEMKTKNCVFIGAPKSNAASEIALALLWDAKPFDDNPANTKKLPIRFFVDAAPTFRSAVVEKGIAGKYGFFIKTASESGLFKVDRRSLRVYEEWSGAGVDAAVIVIAKSPLGTRKDVTTIIILGYTGLATQIATREMIVGEPPIRANEMTQGARHILGYQFQYVKPEPRGAKTTKDPRNEQAPEEGFQSWAPPWAKVFA